MRINLIGDNDDDGVNGSRHVENRDSLPRPIGPAHAGVSTAAADASRAALVPATAHKDDPDVPSFAGAPCISTMGRAPVALATRASLTGGRQDQDPDVNQRSSNNRSGVRNVDNNSVETRDGGECHADAVESPVPCVCPIDSLSSNPAPNTDGDGHSDAATVAHPTDTQDDNNISNDSSDNGNESDSENQVDSRKDVAAQSNDGENRCSNNDASCSFDDTDSGHESDGDEAEYGPADGDNNNKSEKETKSVGGDDHNSGDTSDDSDDSGDDGDGRYSKDSDGDDDSDDGDDSDEYRVRSTRRRKTDTRDQTWARARVPDSQQVPLDEVLAAKAHAGTLTCADLTGVDATTALRLATIDAARSVVQQWWGHPLRGLPMVAGPDSAAPYALLPHQVDALTWMRGREAVEPGRVYGLRGGVLSMRMGLGKTPTSLSLALTAPRGDMPTLIVCSRPVLKEWHTSGVAKFFGAVDATGAPIVRALYLHSDYMSPAAMRAIDRQALSRYDFVLTTYDVCAAECRRGQYDEDCLERGPKGRITVVHTRPRARADRPDLVGPAVLYGTCWERVICDESQRFANPTTGIYRAMMALYGRYKWCLTGTPIRNSHTDIWAQLRFVGYTGIASRAVWKRDGPTFYTRHRLAEAVLVVGHQDQGQDVAAAGRAAQSPLPLSPRARAPTQTSQIRSESTVPTLPPLLHREIVVTLSAPERATYDAVQGLARSALDDVRARASNFACLLSMFTRMRQVAIGAHIMTVGEDTTTRDSIMRVLRRADDAAVTVSDAAARDDPGSRPTAATPSGTLAMTLGSCQARNDPGTAPLSSVPRPTLDRTVPPSGPTTSPTTTSSSSSTTTASSRQETVTVTTVMRPRYPGASTMTTTTTTTSRAGTTPASSSQPGPDVLRIPMRRRLPQSMRSDTDSTPTTYSSTTSTTTAPVVEILDEGDPAEIAADDARESGMGLAMWCLNRRSRAGTRSAKMRAVTRILGQMPTGEKALVFSSFAAALDLAADAITERLPEMAVVQIDGDTRKADRDSILRAFRAPGGPRVLLMTYKVGAEGINLPEANHCLFLEPWWTSAVQEQAYSRCWRVGQTRPVTVYNILAAGTAEERVVRVCHEKSATAAAYMASSAAARRAAATASRRGGEATLDLATLSRIIG
ncbi:SNF2 N-incomplete domain and Helicase C-domain containing protein [Pandoravirus macleodensis]|uniref:SNF2 N-incomplete domain and Helicase C-domain containing protein n=1 Tax=Pandoravirus macleodensis TaxID=2107707 RepID=A0A2U7UF18_9VIRU|nr:SNF2 N-incomplete domain and Helicase C-domain containing protein [Pandoravirus macleodensis]AVK77069.1 SNF2 N-incomplete domain and Helicase C-domain containing protein [Pandoravirus macleodensis]